MEITVYLRDGRIYQYDVVDAIKARREAHRIINYGWRNVEGEHPDKVMVYYPSHQVLKVVFPVPNEWRNIEGTTNGLRESSSIKGGRLRSE